MNEWFNTAINSGNISFSMIIALIVAGFIATFTSCCNYAIIGTITGYSTNHALRTEKKSQLLFSFSFYIGSIVSLSLVGLLIGYVSSSAASLVGNFWKIILAVLLIVFGLFSLGYVPFNIPKLKLNNNKKGFVPGLVLGIATGGLSILCNLCCNPILPIVIGTSFIKASILNGFLILTAFGVGYNLPFAIAIAGIQLGVGKLSKTLNNVGKIIGIIAGIIMILSGFYLIYSY